MSNEIVILPSDEDQQTAIRLFHLIVGLQNGSVPKSSLPLLSPTKVSRGSIPCRRAEFRFRHWESFCTVYRLGFAGQGLLSWNTVERRIDQNNKRRLKARELGLSQVKFTVKVCRDPNNPDEFTIVGGTFVTYPKKMPWEHQLRCRLAITLSVGELERDDEQFARQLQEELRRKKYRESLEGRVIQFSVEGWSGKSVRDFGSLEL